MCKDTARAQTPTGVVAAVVVPVRQGRTPAREVVTEVRAGRRRSPGRLSRIRAVVVGPPVCRRRRGAREPLVVPADPAWAVLAVPANGSTTVNVPLREPPDSHTVVVVVVVVATATTPAQPVRTIRRREGQEVRVPSSFAM